jgi:hypothetical protein
MQARFKKGTGRMPVAPGGWEQAVEERRGEGWSRWALVFGLVVLGQRNAKANGTAERACYLAPGGPRKLGTALPTTSRCPPSR